MLPPPTGCPTECLSRYNLAPPSKMPPPGCPLGAWRGTPRPGVASQKSLEIPGALKLPKSLRSLKSQEPSRATSSRKAGKGRMLVRREVVGRAAFRQEEGWVGSRDRGDLGDSADYIDFKNCAPRRSPSRHSPTGSAAGGSPVGARDCTAARSRPAILPEGNAGRQGSATSGIPGIPAISGLWGGSAIS